MPLSERERELLGQDLLTFIEQREAEQIAYGVYDVTMTGAEVLASYRPLNVALPADADRAALAEHSMAAPAEDTEAPPAASLAEVKLAIVSGHVAMRREVERELRERQGLVECAEVVPSSEVHIDLVRDRTSGRDLVIVVAGYTGHDLTSHVCDLQRASEITGQVIWPRCHGKSGVVREILAAASGG